MKVRLSTLVLHLVALMGAVATPAAPSPTAAPMEKAAAIVSSPWTTTNGDENNDIYSCVVS